MSVEENIEAQRAAYGEQLSEIFGRVKQAFGMNQSELAGILGMSAPMLSQLNSAQRVKIGNPAVLQRLQSLDELAEQLDQGAVSREEVPGRLEGIKASTGRFTRTTSMVSAEAGDAAVVAGMRHLLRAVASGQQIKEAAEQLESTAPALAEVLHTYGIGPVGPAHEHFTRHKDLF
ncbi:DNA-binding protein [Nesterenkonia xinjiangensis]|uniref:Transcriptional regulator with XRE-family HTH domain n=1 Tax=Nesterenkonia xinjiangensis TaxID=225327 RepID=A0A7Z0GJ34_9MICC|nr:DNA-binding protein [Nesterenkonia xinjiangensis]NYJ76922.1 transcriptional regulator with XRE-family HTH domain [Nesterenkonia xinjiangensis]